MSQKPNPPSYKEWKNLPIETKLYIGWITFKSTQWKKIEKKITEKIQRVDLWLFPPLAFIGCYKAISQIIPSEHPMAFNTTMATGLMCATLTLFILRPKSKKLAHWINQEQK